MNKSLLPPNASALERSVEAAQAGRIDAIPVAELQRVWDVDNCPERLLPWLAWAMSVDNWDSNWPIDVKRAVIRDSVKLHKIKGTRAAVEQALSAINCEADIREWFDDKDSLLQPHTFRVTSIYPEEVNLGGGKFERYVADVRRAIDASKRLSTHYVLKVGQRITGASCPNVSSIARLSDEQSLRVEAGADIKHQTLPALIGHMRSVAIFDGLRSRHNVAVALFGKLEAA